MRSKGVLSRGAPSPVQRGPYPPGREEPLCASSPPDDPGSLVGPGILDITRPLGPGVPLYPGDARPSFRSREQEGYTITDLGITTHTGTHLDAPAHFLPGGTTVDRVPLERLMGKARVLDLQEGGNTITAGALGGRLPAGERILLKTRASGVSSFGPEFPHLTREAARALAEARPPVVGIDSPSIEAPGENGSVHRELLERGIPILEFLDLSGVPEGEYLMVALPLRLEGLDGSPARVVLFGEGVAPR